MLKNKKASVSALCVAVLTGWKLNKIQWSTKKTQGQSTSLCVFAETEIPCQYCLLSTETVAQHLKGFQQSTWPTKQYALQAASVCHWLVTFQLFVQLDPNLRKTHEVLSTFHRFLKTERCWFKQLFLARRFKLPRKRRGFLSPAILATTFFRVSNFPEITFPCIPNRCVLTVTSNRRFCQLDQLSNYHSYLLPPV